MSSRSPARFLAPLALLAAVLVVYLVARPELSGSSGASTPTTSTAAKRAPASGGTPARTKATTKKAASKTYTVQPGDVLGEISETTGVAVADLMAYNDLDDAQSLRVGQKLKLAP